MTFCGKLVIFLIFPLVVGMMGLWMAYLATLDDPTKKIRIEADFVFPFMLTLLLVLVVGYQTGGFTSSKPKPALQWPKVQKQRKVIHKHVVKGQTKPTEETTKTTINTPVKGNEAKKKD